MAILFHASLPNFGWLLAIFDIPWLAAASLQFLPPLLHDIFLMSLCLVSLHGLLKEYWSLHFGPNPVRPHLNLMIISTKTFFPKKVKFTGTRVYLPVIQHISLGYTFNPKNLFILFAWCLMNNKFSNICWFELYRHREKSIILFF